jgi:hypothetical protein
MAAGAAASPVHHGVIRHGAMDRISRKDDFQSYVSRGQPVIIVDEIKEWKAFKQWGLPYFRSVFSQRNDFAIVDRALLSFKDFADKLETNQPNVWAPQMSLTGRAAGLFDNTAPELKDDVEYPSVISKESLDEINVWIGRGATPLHFDGYDNLLAVIRGVKRILLLEPKWFEHVYIDRFQWASVDIRNRDLKKFPRLAEVPEPVELILNEGEMLYIPAHWLHQVDVPEGHAITLNYWYRSQHGQPSSGFTNYFYDAMLNMLRMYGDMNEVEKADGARRLRAVVDQLNEGRSPASHKGETWSGGNNVFSQFRV